ncbi:MAG: hypothetical protein GX306_06085 [Clostridiales bacterium]|nr:hypothetical protein [Clostridiales bacterium]
MILAAILMIILPLQYIAESQVEIMDQIVDSHTRKFMDTIRQKGSITLDQYEEYLYKLSQTGEIYNIEIEHSVPKTAGDMISERTYSGSLLASIEDNDLPVFSLKHSNGEEKQISTFTSHTHFEACYGRCDGLDYNEDGKFDLNDCINQYAYGTSSIPQKYNDQVPELQEKRAYRIDMYICRGCDTAIYTRYKYSDYVNSTGVQLAEAFNQHGLSTEVRCDEVIIDIKANKPSQTLSHGIFDDRATITYLDGHKEENVPCYSNYDPLKAGVQDVKLSMHGLVDNASTYGTKTANVTVNVVEPHKKSCFEDYHVHSEECIPEVNDSNFRDMVYFYYNDRYPIDGHNFLDYIAQSITVRSALTNHALANFIYGYDKDPPSNSNSMVLHGGSLDAYRMAYGKNGSIVKHTYGRVGKFITYRHKDRNNINWDDYDAMYNRFRILAGITYRIFDYHSSYYDNYNNYVSYADFDGKMYFNPNKTYWRASTNTSYAFFPHMDFFRRLRDAYKDYEIALNVGNNQPGGFKYDLTSDYEDYCLPFINSEENILNGEPDIIWLPFYGDVYSGNSSINPYDLSCGHTNNPTPLCNVPSSLTVTASSYTVPNGTQPTYTVKANYSNGTSKLLSSNEYSKSGWSSGPGIKAVTFTYTEKGITVSATIYITVTQNLVSIAVTPATQTIERYKNPSFQVRVYYEDGTNKTTSAYQLSGFNNKTIGMQTVTISYTENGITKTTTAMVNVTNMTRVCPTCGTRYQLDHKDIDRGCPVCSSTLTGITVAPNSVRVNRGDPLPISVHATYQNGGRALVIDWSSDYDPMKAGFQYVCISYLGYKAYITVEVVETTKTCPICSHIYPLNPDGSDPGCPYCSKLVESISVNPNHVTIQMHQPFDVTVIAKFKDGHTEVVTGWTTNFVPEKAGTFEAMIYYQSASCPITITVIGDSLDYCEYCGLEYDGSQYPEGCPVCSNMIIGIIASLRNKSGKVIKGSDLDLEIEVLYRDTHRIAVYTGYTVTNYYPHQLGEQTITVHYQGHNSNLTIEVIDTLTKVICPNGHEYYLNENATNPGCPYCSDGNPKKNAIIYYDITYTKEIIDVIYGDGKYRMKKGDYISITVTKQNKSLRSNIKRLFRSLKGDKQSITYGGEIHESSI